MAIVSIAVSVRRRSNRKRGWSMPSRTFSATVIEGTSAKCWWTMPMPCAIASRGDRNATGVPSSSSCPSSGR